MARATPKLYICVMLGILGLFAVYGFVDNILLQRILEKFPPKGEWPFSQKLTVYFAVGVNCFYLLAAIIGVIAVNTKKLFLFNWSGFILLGSFAAQLIHGVACLRASMQPMTGNIFSTFRQNPNDSHYAKWLDDFQWQYDCCGIKSYMDWRIFKFHVDEYDVPDTCCLKRESAPALGCGGGVTEPNVTVTHAAALIHTEGCGDAISKSYQDDIRILGLTMIVLAFLGLGGGMTIFTCQHKTFLLLTRRPAQDRRQNKATEVAASPRRRSGSGSGSSQEDCGSETSDQDLGNAADAVLSSFYNRPIGNPKQGFRSRVARQDSKRNFPHKQWMPKHNLKYKAYQKYKTGMNPGQVKNSAKYGKPANRDMRTKLEMLLHPIETQSTNSAVPMPSSLFPFRTSATPKTSSIYFTAKKDGDPANVMKPNGANGNVEARLPHYNSLPQVKTFPNTATSYHYKASHTHTLKKKPPTYLKSGGGKFPSVMMVSQFPPIQEENESITSGNSHASTGSPSASSSPKSLSKSSSKLLDGQLAMCNALIHLGKDQVTLHWSQDEDESEAELGSKGGENNNEPATQLTRTPLQVDPCHSHGREAGPGEENAVSVNGIGELKQTTEDVF